MAPVFILDVPSHRFVSYIMKIVIYVMIQMLLYVVIYKINVVQSSFAV